MNTDLRKKVVAAMELLVRQVNDEELLDTWLTIGVADGDIPENSLSIKDVEDYYIDDKTFKRLMHCFLITMSEAKEDGGLFCDSVCSD